MARPARRESRRVPVPDVGVAVLMVDTPCGRAPSRHRGRSRRRRTCRPRTVLRDAADGSLVAEIATYLGVRTNNYAEWTAVELALEEALAHGAAHVDLRLDSELVAQGRESLDPALAYLRLGAAANLNQTHLKVLRSLAAWREQQAGVDLDRNAEGPFGDIDLPRLGQRRQHAADLVSIKLMKHGGIHRAKAIAAITEAAAIPCYAGAMWESGVGIAAALHLWLRRRT